MGSGGGSSGGSGSSGKVDWPTYFKNSHERMLNTGVTPYDGTQNSPVSMEQALYEGWDNSPYSSAYTHDPSADITDVESDVADVETLVDALSPATDWEGFVDTVLAKLGTVLLSDSDVNEAYDAFATRQTPKLMRTLGRFAGAMADIGAHNSSALWLGMAALQAEHLDELARFNTELSLKRISDRVAIVMQSVDQLLRTQLAKVQASTSYANLSVEAFRIKTLAMREYLDRDLEIAVKDHLWNLELFAFGGNMLAAGQGGIGPTSSKDQSSKPGGLTSMLGGALSGGAAGAGLATALAIPTGGLSYAIMGAGALLGGGLSA